MATRTAELLSHGAAAPHPIRSSLITETHANLAKPISICHFTTAHTALKSRSFHRQCLPLANAGFQVSFVSPASIRGVRDRIDFVHVPNPPSTVGRLLGQLRLLRTLLRLHADIYHFQDPQLLPLALLLKLAFRKRIVYDAYEDFPSMASRKASLPRPLRPLAARAIAIAESLAARIFDAIATADSPTMRRLARTGRSRKLVFYNFPNLDFFPAPQPRIKRFDLVYRGGLSDRAGTFLLLQALHLLARENRRVRLLLIGYCDSAQSERRLHQRIAELGLASNVEVRSRIPHEQMSPALSEARIGLSPLLDTPKFRLNIPVKIFEYWACALPVIASDLPPSRPFIDRSTALTFPPGDANALARAIAHLLDNPRTAQAMGERGRLIIERRLNNTHEARKWISLCLALAPASPASAQEPQHA
jgi:glycosyltransferase involved in cell wall biosynthesis